MKIFAETERLILRELEFTDENDLFEMDSDPAVHLYIENNPVKSIDQITKVIEMLKKQYHENGIARWAVVDKNTNECIGWSGLKYFNQPLNNHNHFYPFLFINCFTHSVLFNYIFIFNLTSSL